MGKIPRGKPTVRAAKGSSEQARAMKVEGAAISKMDGTGVDVGRRALARAAMRKRMAGIKGKRGKK